MHHQVLYLQAFIFVWLACKFVKKLFFGALRASEIEVHTHTHIDQYEGNTSNPIP